MANFSLPPVGMSNPASSSSSSSSAKLPTDPKQNKEAVKKMQAQQILDAFDKMLDKAKERAKAAMEGKDTFSAL
jgi:hypothetical protein